MTYLTWWIQNQSQGLLSPRSTFTWPLILFKGPKCCGIGGCFQNPRPLLRDQEQGPLGELFFERKYEEDIQVMTLHLTIQKNLGNTNSISSGYTRKASLIRCCGCSRVFTDWTPLREDTVAYLWAQGYVVWSSGPLLWPTPSFLLPLLANLKCFISSNC